MNSYATTWEAICNDPSLRDLPYKIETNRYNNIVMSPASNWHSRYEARIVVLLEKLMRGGEQLTECAVQTAEGIRVPDVAWISNRRHKPYADMASFPVAPEICVEVVSPGNSKEEMQEKSRLYFAAGAGEVWFCNIEGCMEFYTAESPLKPVKQSKLCPKFPRKLPRKKSSR
jgi:Uma2 family endonuclease